MPHAPRFFEHYCKADRIMLGVLWLMFICSLALAILHDTFLQAIAIGGGTCLALTAMYRAIGGTRLMRCCVAFGLMVMAALHINQAEA
jgi:methyl-accepting chemotaxis protein